MGDMNLSTLKVTITAATAPLKNAMNKSVQDVRAAVSSIRKDTAKVQEPFRNIRTDSATAALQSIQKKMKDTVLDYQVRAGIKVPTEEYQEVRGQIQEVESQIQEAEEKLEGYYSRLEKVKALAGGNGLSGNKEWQSLQYDIQETTDRLEEYRAEAAGLNQARAAMKAALEEHQEAESQLREVESQIRKTEGKLESYYNRLEKMETLAGGQYLPGNKAWESLQYDIQKAADRLEEYRAKAAELNQAKAGIKAPPEGYQEAESQLREVESQIQKAEEKLKGYHDRLKKMETMAGDNGLSGNKAWQSLQYDIQKTIDKLEEYKAEAAGLESSGEGYERPVSLPGQALNFGKSILGAEGIAFPQAQPRRAGAA